MLFNWLRRRRRAGLLAQPFPADWLPILERNVRHYRYLTGDEQAKLRDALRIFIAEKHWEGCGGLQMTDEIKVTIAAQACLLLLGLEDEDFDNVLSILVYPHGYEAPAPELAPLGMVVQESSARLGEAHYRGPVVLAWDEVLHDGRHPSSGKNLVLHEFAHQLDMLDGTVNGTPPLRSPELNRRWEQVMTGEFRRLRAATQAGRATLLDGYGATNEAEFFAVATECFFDRPMELAHRHPGLYELLRDYYRQDPATRCRHCAEG